MGDLIKMRMNDGRIIAVEPMEAMGITKAHLGVPYDSDFEEKLNKAVAPETAINSPAAEKAVRPEASAAKTAMREKIKKGPHK